MEPKGWWHKEVEDLKQQLTAMTAERDAYMRDYGEEQDRKREVAQKLAEANRKVEYWKQQRESSAAYERILRDDHIKREVMLRAIASDFVKQYPMFANRADMQALATTADLKDVRLCHADPFSWYSTELDEFRDDEDQYFSLPVYRAWEPK